MPALKRHPYGPSWGIRLQLLRGLAAMELRRFRYLIDHLHQRGLGVIWLGAFTFPKTLFALGRFDGSALYEHLDPRKGEHQDWGTYIFNSVAMRCGFSGFQRTYWLKDFISTVCGWMRRVHALSRLQPEGR